MVNDEDSDDNSDDATKKRNGKLATSIWKDAIKVAAREASRNIQGCKLAILSEADDDDDLETSAAQQGGGLLDGLFAGKSTTTIPKSLSAAIQATSKLRHGTVFGTPESSVCHDAFLTFLLFLLIVLTTVSHAFLFDTPLGKIVSIIPAHLLDSCGWPTKESNPL